MNDDYVDWYRSRFGVTPNTFTRADLHDPLSTARGVMVGLGLGVAAWTIAAIVWWAVR